MSKVAVRLQQVKKHLINGLIRHLAQSRLFGYVIVLLPLLQFRRAVKRVLNPLLYEFEKPIENPNSSSSNSVQRLALIQFSDCKPYDEPSKSGLTIDGVSVNLITEEVPCGIMTGDLTVTGGGSLDIDMGFKHWEGDDKSTSDNMYGVYAKELTVDGTDNTLKQLDISISSDTNKGMYLDGLYLEKNLNLSKCSAAIKIVDNVAIHDDSGAVGIGIIDYNIDADGQATILNSTVDIKVKGKRADGILAQTTGISVTNSEMNITATSTNGSTGIQTSSKDIEIDNSAVNIKSIQTENQGGQIDGIYSPTCNVIIQKQSTVTIVGQSISPNPSRSCLDGKNVTVTGNSTVNITGTATANTTDPSEQERVDSYGISAVDTFTAEDSTVNVDLTTTISPNVTYSKIVKSWGINGGKSVSIDNSAVNVISRGNLTEATLAENPTFIFRGISSFEEVYGEDDKIGTISVSGNEEVKADVILTGTSRTGEAFMPTATLIPDADGNTLLIEKKPDGAWYYLDAKTGVRQLGWQKSGNTWYYLDPASGKMYAGGEYLIGGETYYFYSWGGMASGWWYLDEETGLWYYFRGNGAMAKNAWIEWKGKYYYVGSTGAMLVNTTTPDGYRVDGRGKWIR